MMVTGIEMVIALMMEAVCTSETSVSIYQKNGATSQKTAIFTLVYPFLSFVFDFSVCILGFLFFISSTYVLTLA
jgi:hypothetical protein